MKVAAALIAGLSLTLQSCSVGGGCSDVGGFDGVVVEIPRALFVASGAVTVEVCASGTCADATEPLAPVPGGPVGRAVNITFDDLGRRFGTGSADLQVELTDSRGQVLAAARRSVDLTRSYPNGRACDGGGYVGGTITLTSRDRLRA